MLRMGEWVDGLKDEAASVGSQSIVLGVRPPSLSLIQRVENSVVGGGTSDMPSQPALFLQSPRSVLAWPLGSRGMPVRPHAL